MRNILPELVHHTEKLYYFYSIVEQGSLQACSRKLSISAPTLSYSIKELESVTKTQLLIRSKKGVTPTQAGKTLHLFCKDMFLRIEDLQEQLEGEQHRQRRKVRIGTFPSIALYFWPSLQSSLQKEDTINFSIKTDRSDNILESIVQKDIDISITVEGQQMRKLVSHKLYKDQYAFYSCSNKDTLVETSELKNQTLFYIPDARDSLDKSLKNYIEAWDLKFDSISELDSFEVVAEFIKRGYGVGILPVQVAKAYGKSLQQLRIKGLTSGLFGEHSFYLSYRTDLDLPDKYIKSILKAARKAVKEMLQQ